MSRAAGARRLPLVLALLAAAALVAAVFAVVPVRSDMTELLPQGRSEAARLMLAELRSGSAGGPGSGRHRGRRRRRCWRASATG